jgi:hypothetical protein
MTLQSRYTILRKIADGGTAEIFLAKQHGAHGFEKSVVLKRIFTAFYADPQFQALGTLARVADPDLGTVTMPNVLFRMSESPGSIRWAGPASSRV